MTPQGQKRRWHIFTQNYGPRQNLVFTVVNHGDDRPGRKVACPYRWSERVDKVTGGMVGLRLVLGDVKSSTTYMFRLVSTPLNIFPCSTITSSVDWVYSWGCGIWWTQLNSEDTTQAKNGSITAGGRGTKGWQVPLQTAAKTDRWGCPRIPIPLFRAFSLEMKKAMPGELQNRLDNLMGQIEMDWVVFIMGRTTRKENVRRKKSIYSWPVN